MIAFLADADFPHPAVVALRTLGFDVLTLSEVGLAGVGTSDIDVLVEAVRTGRALLTLNRRHFTALHNRDSEHAGIITCTPDIDFGALAARIATAFEADTTLQGRLIVVRRPHPAG